MQTNNRLGCLTGTGIFAALVTIAAIAGLAFFSGSQMFTAGALNAEPGDEVLGSVNSHAQITECSACHAEPWSATRMADHCAKCHTDIAAQMYDVAQLHGAIMQKNNTLACRDCHPEHRGASASLTEMGENTFPHEALGYSLEGHQQKATGEAFICKDCHGEDVTTFASNSCDNCHRQMDIVFTQTHVLSFGTDCLACHDGIDRYGDNFTHDQFPFQLKGEHAEANCTECHLDARSIADLQSLPQDCFSCHREDDPHGGAYGNECGVCHAPEGWLPAKFDHNLSAFKLEGEHNEVACEKCHVNNVYKGTPSDCYSCHQQDDEHNGRFGTQCETCHTPKNWESANFDHNLTAFKLDGEHREVRCERCHVNNVFKGTPTDCYSCHQQNDEHNGKFGTDCASCHNTNDWDDATFDHSRTNFPLTGGHSGVDCEQCHKGDSFTGLSNECVSCHADPAFHAGVFGTNCATCHTIFAWTPAGFNIQHPEPIAEEGGNGVFHGGASCRQCHPSTVQEATCTACHDGNDFEGGEGGDDD
ncbi:MAG TPA: cytochrome c3 family protein [Anaerolineales bacterium]|nr:cytochrome c3 family protein [Anaerolineales bacterium]HNB85073.1 cytochrome c3 family protein [Anaerolineales bacterium]HNE68912.1 cytochrome c3 family protein [Anaerolineales bacterium]HNH77999.1 cytochrome c3 family protein [Anaerolineales bacterium]HNJ12813.1 cytochrome c3 family protein [Anaerolineales bacterium]